ncbi:putative inactive purple acid phosphatase 16 [Orchesella cincta]|uniref:Putative inactive purple acid phosphatase 16 n=1 Tax=Orchesella cincta TaxID=48709 RepID=A0A1D2N8N0_ORCCI|nr:putative inactive purple acid phosphatase 16 [Orchesella cincta]
MKTFFLIALVGLLAPQTIYGGIVIKRNPSRPPVHFNSNGTFKIVTFTDLHYGEGAGSDWGPANDIKSTKVMFDILDWEKPDFVVFTGDLMSAEVMLELDGTQWTQLLTVQ